MSTVKCERCGGNGIDPLSPPHPDYLNPCDLCNGSGGEPFDWNNYWFEREVEAKWPWIKNIKTNYGTLSI